LSDEESGAVDADEDDEEEEVQEDESADTENSGYSTSIK
jgi:hypothetical protein